MAVVEYNLCRPHPARFQRRWPIVPPSAGKAPQRATEAPKAAAVADPGPTATADTGPATEAREG
jgi:hypothetical protein